MFFLSTHPPISTLFFFYTLKCTGNTTKHSVKLRGETVNQEKKKKKKMLNLGWNGDDNLVFIFIRHAALAKRWWFICRDARVRLKRSVNIKSRASGCWLMIVKTHWPSKHGEEFKRSLFCAIWRPVESVPDRNIEIPGRVAYSEWNHQTFEKDSPAIGAILSTSMNA